MSTPASIKGHPIHPMLVPLVIGLWTFALVADVMTHVRGGQEWRTVAFYCIGGGLVSAVLAAVPGVIDLVSIKVPRVRRKGLIHLGTNLLALLVFGVNFVSRLENADHSGMLRLTALGIVLISISGWFGGEMVFKHGVGVEPVASDRAAPPTAS
jgi:uncharacterized membrane protein